MGEVTRVEVADNASLQRALLDNITAAQAHDPLAPVTLVVDTPGQGWLLRRQLARALPLGQGIANLRTCTAAELLTDLAAAVGITAPGQRDATLRAAAIASVLRGDTGALERVRDHPDTALRLAQVTDDLAWCPLDSTPPPTTSATARAAIEFAGRARTAIRDSLGEPTWPEVAEKITTALSTKLPTDPGAVLVCAQRVPSPVRDVLTALAQHRPVTHLELQPADARITARVLTCPDPATEAAMAVRLAADAVRTGTPVDRVAILYSTAQPYAALLEEALGQAGLAWNGPTGRLLAASNVGRGALAIAEMAAERSEQSSGITRPALMRWLGAGRVHDGTDFVSAGSLRALMREKGLYGDAAGWLPRLHSLSTPEPDEDGEISTRAERDAAAAAALARLITALDAHLTAITAATTWTQAGSALWQAVEALHLQSSTQADPLERAAAAAAQSTLCESMPGIDALPQLGGGTPLAPDAASIAEVLARAFGSGRAIHGATAVGLFVGPVASARGLQFDQVVLVGASEGLLPAVRGDDPLLPAAARRSMRREQDDLPTAAESEATTAATVRGVCAAATHTVALYSRGGLPGKAVGLPSRYLPKHVKDVAEHTQVASHRASLALDPPPLAPADLRVRSALGAVNAPAELEPLVLSLAAWRSPQPGPHFGTPGDVDGQPAYALNGARLSASAIEAFLHCPYHFFVARVLGISTDEYVDQIDTMEAKDIGTLLHSALERLVHEANAAGSLPDYGAPWPEGTLERLQALLDDEVATARAEGRTGWEPAWQRTYAMVTRSLPLFLELDAELRAPTEARPLAPELAFTVPFEVEPGVQVDLRGFIDRLDGSADGRFVGVVDYKSGKFDGFAKRLGAKDPAERDKVQDLVYDAAARALHPDATDVGVAFVFVPNRGEPAVVDADHEPDRPEALRTLLASLNTSGATGAFGPTPKGARDFCPVCKRLGRRAWQVAGAAQTDADEEEAQ